jgi:hypothetical protein
LRSPTKTNQIKSVTYKKNDFFLISLSYSFREMVFEYTKAQRTDKHSVLSGVLLARNMNVK